MNGQFDANILRYKEVYFEIAYEKHAVISEMFNIHAHKETIPRYN